MANTTLAINRTVPYPFEGQAAAASTLTISSTSIVGFPSGGIVVGWDILNTSTTTGQILRVRLGPSGTAITTPSGGPPSTTLGNAIPLDAGKSYSFSRSEDQYSTTDQTVWGVLLVRSYVGDYSFTGVATVLLPPGVSP